jgi:hypothetical protein
VRDSLLIEPFRGRKKQVRPLAPPRLTGKDEGERPSFFFRALPIWMKR